MGGAAEAVQALATTLEYATAATAVTNLAIATLQTGALSQLWGMINGLQIFVHIPLLKTIFPSNTELVIKELSEFATFDILPTSTYLGWALEFPDEYEEGAIQ